MLHVRQVGGQAWKSHIWSPRRALVSRAAGTGGIYYASSIIRGLARGATDTARIRPLSDHVTIGYHQSREGSELERARTKRGILSDVVAACAGCAGITDVSSLMMLV